MLGDAEVVFLRFPTGPLAPRPARFFREQLLDFHPDWCCSQPGRDPSRSCGRWRAFFDTVQHDETLFADLAVTRVAFYEVSAPLPRPNALVDISDVAETKYAAIAQHASQLAMHITSPTRALNTYRAMTLPSRLEVRRGVFRPSICPRCAPRRWRAAAKDGGGPAVETVREVLRERGHPHEGSPGAAREAIRVGAGHGYPCEIVW